MMDSYVTQRQNTGSPSSTNAPCHRDGSLSLLRVIATVMIVTVHISGMVLAQWSHPYWWAGNIYDAIGQMGVPIFLMITGSLFLPKAEGASQFWRKRAARLLPPTLFWACIYLGWAGVSVSEWPIKLLTVQVEYFHLWYLYMLIALSFVVPILSAFYRASRLSDRIYYVGLWAVFSIGVTTWRLTAGAAASAEVDILGSFGLYLPIGYAGYLFVGAWIYQAQISRVGRIFAWSAAAIGLLGLTLVTYFLSAKAGNADTRYFNYLAPFIAIGGVGVFAGFKGLKIREGRLLRWMSECALGVYVVHLGLIREVASYGINGNSGNAWLTIPYAVATVILVSLCIVTAIRLTRVGRWIT